MKKVFSNLLLLMAYPFRLLKKSRFDNFMAGVIFGAFFSLIVNIATVKVQEDIQKQRTLEALEREMIGHIITTKGVVSNATEIIKASGNDKKDADIIMSERLATRVWDDPTVSRYIFELDYLTAGKVQLYYEVVVASTNRLLEADNNLYLKLYEPCEPFYTLISELEGKSNQACNQIANTFVEIQAKSYEHVPGYLKDIFDSFHPTRDRLQSWWLRALLGDEAPNILR